MPPNKRKKKPASNPARGFTTVSVPSKQKAAGSSGQVSSEDVSKDGLQSPPEQKSSQPSSEPATSDRKLELHGLSPEELEKHLEEAELRSIVEKYASKCKNDASRQATKLETERRVVRPQAQPLFVTNWLPSELLNQILEKEKKELEKPQSHPSNGFVGDYSKLATEEERCAKIWTLQQTLLELGMPENKIDEALKNVLACSTGDFLEHALEWLAMHCDEGELPQYGERITAPKATETFQTGGVTSGTVTPQDKGSRTRKPITSQPPTPLDSTSDESDFSDDPQSLVPRYVSLKSRLYDIQPSVFDGSRSKSKKSKPGKQVEAESDPNVVKLRRKLAKVEKDVLFDSQQAEERWQEELAELRMKAADSSRQRLGESFADTRKQEIDTETPPEPKVHEKEQDSEDDDEGGLLGSMFLSEPDNSAEESVTLLGDANTTVNHRDFGNPGGMSPRRVLDEACRARDARYKINYRNIFSSPHSHRKRVEITWSKDHSPPPPMGLDDVSCTADSRSTTVSMVSVSTPTSQQAESYISVVALFMLFSHSPKESRSFMRLPTPWRDLWAELAEVKKEHEDKAHVETIKNIRNILHESKSDLNEDVVLTHNFKRRNGGSSARETEGTAQANGGLDPETLKGLWAVRCSSVSFKKMLAGRQTLPIWSFKERILEVLETNQVMIICSETGSGKSTQIPSFILENELMSGRHCKVYVTEPRRISAMSLAKRVSDELGEGKDAVGTNRSLVGYAIRLESKVTTSTRLIFATTGVIIRLLERPHEFQDITHLVLDEVHERTIDSDFLLIILRRLLKERPNLKLVLMSATVDARRFSAYLHGAPILDIPGRTFPVEVRHLEDAIGLLGYHPDEQRISADTDDSDEESPERTSQTEGDLSSSLANYSKRTRDALTKFDEYRTDYRLIVSLLSKIATSSEMEEYSKAVLVFMPGLAEIRRLHDEITSEPLFQKDWIVYSLHSSIATEDQEKAFLTPPKGVRKIVIATNIAETGITIPDITAVIDTGKEKVMRFDEKRQISRLVESFISRANAKQRRGRAGRVQNGICFHLFTKHRHDKILSEQQTPEILRLSLQDLILRVKICNMGEIEGTLAEALDPPSAKNIRRAIEALKEVKALTEGEGLTPLGRQLARLPLDVFLGKLVLYGTVFKCLDAAVSIAAILSCKSPFVTTVGSSTQKELARRSFNRGDSDLLTLYNAYSAWKRSRSTPGMSEFTFCRKSCLSPQALLNIEDVKTQLVVSIVDMGLLKLDAAEEAGLRKSRFTSRQRQFFTIPARIDINSANDTIMNSVIAWSFYPRLLAREGKKGWRNISNNQAVTLHPTSVNRGSDAPLKWLSFYHIMQARSRSYNAHETSAVEDISVALLCGDAVFKMYSGIIAIDGNRIRFSLRDWKSILALKALSTRIREILAFTFRDPKKAVLSPRQMEWLDLWQQVFSQER